MFHLMLGSEKDEHRIHPCMCSFGFKCWWLVCWLPAPNWDLEEATEVRPLLGSGECWVQEKQNFLGDACKRQQEWPRELVDQWHSYGKDWVSVIIYEKRWREEQEVKNIVEPGQNLCWSCFCCHGVYESWLDALFLVFKKHREKPNKRLRKIIVCGCPAFLEKRLLKHLDLFFFWELHWMRKISEEGGTGSQMCLPGSAEGMKSPRGVWAGEAGPPLCRSCWANP